MSAVACNSANRLGALPVGWLVKPIGELAVIATGNTPPTADASNYGDDFLFASPADIDDSKWIHQTGKRLSRKGFSLARPFPAKSVLFVCIGSTIGKCAIASVELTSNQQINAVFPSEHLDSEFLYYSLRMAAPGVKEQAGEQAVPLVNKTQFSSTLIAVPKLSEQRAIATALSDVDALIFGLEKLIAKKRDLKQAALQQLLTGQTRLPGFSVEWTVKRLGDHFTILKNGVNSRAELSVEGGVAYLHYGDIHGSKSLFLNPQNTSMPTLPLAKAKDLDRLQSGDLVFADASEDLDGVGKSVEVQGSDVLDLVSGQHTIAIRFDKTVLADGFKAYLQFFPAFSAHLYRLAAGTKVYATNRSHIASAEIKLPEVDEQIAIASILHSMDTELASIENRLEKVLQLKQGMMQELLTGRTRLV